MLPMNTAFFHFFIPHVYGSLWCLKHWSVRQIKPAQLAFGRTLIYLLTYLLTYLHPYYTLENRKPCWRHLGANS